MWQFLSDHIAFAIIALLLVVGVAMFIIKVGIKLKSGNKELEIGDRNKDMNLSIKDAMSNAIIVSSLANRWKSDLDNKIKSLEKDVITSCTKAATKTIEMYCDDARLEYGKFLKEEKKELSTIENYQIIMYGFILDSVRELFKDIICELIREDHFDSKTSTELSEIGSDAFRQAKNKFESQKESCGLKRDILIKIAEKYEPIVKENSKNIINNTSEKYKKLKEDIKNLVTSETEKEKEELRLKFSNFPSEYIENLVNYYN